MSAPTIHSSTSSSLIWRPILAGGECEFWSARPDFTPDDIHVWHIDLEGSDLNEDLAILNPEERVRSARFHFDRDRNRFIACRGALRRLLGHCLNLPPQSIGFDRGLHGKPTISSAQARGLTFNLSHSRQSALIAISRDRAMGIDIEYIRDNLDPLALATRFFTPTEADFVRRHAPAEQSRAFFEVWVRKEAWLKLVGVGLSGHLAHFDVTPWLDEARLPNSRGGNPIILNLSQAASAPFLAALATEPPLPRIFLWQMIARE